MRLSGKVAVITGASMGIGEAVARLFAGEGASVVLSSRDAGRAESARARVGHPERTVAFACDVRQREQIESLLTAALNKYGRVDIWVNNAGHGMIDSVADMDMTACREMFETNLFGAVNGMQVAAAAMRQQGGGSIINISSVAGHIALPYSAAYSGTKFALNAIGKAARRELRGSGIHVLTVCPGFVATNFGRNVVRGQGQRKAESPIAGISAERAARAVLRGYLKQKREIVVPWRDRIFIKLYQLWPSMVEFGMARFIKPLAPTREDAREVTPVH